VVLTTATRAPDGRWLAIGNWTNADAPDGHPRHPTVWTSTDGLAWTRQPDSPAFVSRRPNWEEGVSEVVATRFGFVAVGAETFVDSSAASAAAWFSVDGAHWMRAVVPDAAPRTMDHVLVTSAGLVALGEAGYDFHAGFGAGTAEWTSVDGRAWHKVPDADAPPHGARLRGFVARGEGGFLATAQLEYSEGIEDAPRPAVTEGIWRSSDGIHWKPISPTPLGAFELVATSTGFEAAGGGVTVWHSTGVRSWTGVSLPTPPDLPVGGTAYVAQLVSGPTGILAFGERDDDFSTLEWASADGLAWTAISPSALLRSVAIDGIASSDGVILVMGEVSGGSGPPVLWKLVPGP
jgi:hypothetical protein